VLANTASFVAADTTGLVVDRMIGRRNFTLQSKRHAELHASVVHKSCQDTAYIRLPQL